MLHVTYAGASEWDEQSARHLPGLVVERWEGVSIFLHMDQPEKFDARMERFLEENRLVQLVQGFRVQVLAVSFIKAFQSYLYTYKV